MVKYLKENVTLTVKLSVKWKVLAMNIEKLQQIYVYQYDLEDRYLIFYLHKKKKTIYITYNI